MSRVDTQFSALERDSLLREIREHLPAFLSAEAVEQVDPSGDVEDLLNLTSRDLERVVAAHVGLSDAVRAFVVGLHQGLRNPTASTVRPRVATQAVKGPIDWGATIRHRAGAGGATRDFVVRPARRVFDTPENRTLAYVLERLEVQLRRAAPAGVADQTDVHDTGWLRELGGTLALIRDARRHHWLRDVPAERPTAHALRRLRAARTAFYKELIPAVLDALQRYTENPSAEDLTELLTKRYFEPQRDWRLFELVIALRLARAVAHKSGGQRKARLLVGVGRVAYARYVMPDGAEVHLWYQAWPSDTGESLHSEARARYLISGGPSRPDFVAQLRRDGGSVDSLLLEAKATQSASYLGAGLLQLLGYLKDRPGLFATQPAGWLVAPRSAAFASRDPGSSELWAVAVEDVAQAVVERFGYAG